MENIHLSSRALSGYKGQPVLMMVHEGRFPYEDERLYVGKISSYNSDLIMLNLHSEIKRKPFPDFWKWEVSVNQGISGEHLKVKRSEVSRLKKIIERIESADVSEGEEKVLQRRKVISIIKLPKT